VRSAHEHAAATFEFDGITHHVVREDGAADIELAPKMVTWRFDDTRLAEMLDLMVPMVINTSPGHQYVDDLRNPVEVLVLSVGEYIGNPLWGDFPELYPPPTLCQPQDPSV
jgi:hypothetical protein